MSDPPSINALFSFFENFIKFGHFFQTFFCFAEFISYKTSSFQLLVFSPILSIPKIWPKIFKFDDFQQKGVWGGLSGY